MGPVQNVCIKCTRLQLFVSDYLLDLNALRLENNYAVSFMSVSKHNSIITEDKMKQKRTIKMPRGASR